MREKAKKKGNPGYLPYLKKKFLLLSILEFGIAFCILGAGYWKTGNLKNICTVVCVVGVLPASMMLVEYIAVYACRGISSGEYEEIQRLAPSLVVIYDLLFTCQDKIMPVKSLVILNEFVCGFGDSDVCDVEELEEYIRGVCERQCDVNVNVRLFKEYHQFLCRVEGMNNIFLVDRPDNIRENRLANAILSVSM